MRNLFLTAVTVLAVAMMLAGNALSQTQQAAPAKPKTAAPAKAHTAATAKAPAKTSAAPVAPSTPTDKFSYALGMNLGASLHHQSVAVNPNVLLRGLKDGLAGGKTLMTEDEARAALMEVQNEVRKKQTEEAQKVSAANQKEGDDFLAANKAKEGVVTLPSGLQYKILKEGNGPKPTASDSVECNYKGTLINGTEFDSSYKRGEPVTFPVSGVIKGWTEALQLMPVGSKWELFVPASLAYGERAPGGGIGPNSTLIFDVELLSIKPKEEPKKPEEKPAEKAPEKAPEGQPQQ